MRRDRYCVPGIQHVLRCWNNEVFENTEGVLQAIYDALTPTLSQREREFQAEDTCLRQAGAIVGPIGLMKKLRNPCYPEGEFYKKPTIISYLKCLNGKKAGRIEEVVYKLLSER